MDADVIVVGGGVAGLACARTLASAGRVPVVLERADAPGGRVRTDEVEGFRLDRGFQVLPLAYPEARLLLDFDALELHQFERGAIVRVDGRFRRVVDPRASALQGLRTLAGGVVTAKDALAVARLLHNRSEETTAAERLREAGLSRRAVEAFFAPFLRGIFLEPALATSSRFLDFVLESFSAAPAAIPARGMGAIASQLAAGLDVRTGLEVTAVGPRAVSLASGVQLRARAVVVATSGLLDEPQHGWNAVSCTYYDAPSAPLPGAWLVLNGEGGTINNLCVLSEVAPSFAPAGRALVSVSALGPDEPDPEALRGELTGWFGAAARRWRHLRTYVVRDALPAFPVGAALERAPRLTDGLFACGDHREHPSLNGALASGRRAAHAVLATEPRSAPPSGILPDVPDEGGQTG